MLELILNFLLLSLSFVVWTFLIHWNWVGLSLELFSVRYFWNSLPCHQKVWLHSSPNWWVNHSSNALTVLSNIECCWIGSRIYQELLNVQYLFTLYAFLYIFSLLPEAFKTLAEPNYILQIQFMWRLILNVVQGEM